MPESIITLPPDSTGRKLRTRQRTIGANTVEEQFVIPTEDAVVTFRGRANTFRTPGRAGTTGQRLAALHNATGSTILVRVNQVAVDCYFTVVKAITVAPPIIRVHRVTVLPTNGAACAKVNKHTGETSNVAVTAFQDASADGTSAGTTLTTTIPANTVLSQEVAPRFITAAGYEMFDRTTFFEGDHNTLVLGALEGIVVELVYTATGQNPITDMWVVGIDWDEFTLP